MGYVWRILLAVSGLLSLWGCFGHEVVVPPPQELSALRYAQQMLTEMSTGMDRLLSPARTRIQDEGDYRVLVGSAHVASAKAILDNFARFCQRLGGSMVGKACRKGTEDDVKFVVHTTVEPLTRPSATAFQQVTVTLEVYEPVGTPSARFLQAMRPYGYLSQAEREAQDKTHHEEGAASSFTPVSSTGQGQPASVLTPAPPSPSSPAPPERRVALVIGNSAYQQVSPLRNPVHDAEDIAALLHTLHFRVRLLQNATYREMEDAIQRFATALRSEEVGLLYFAGHGIQIEGNNYLIPTDAFLNSAADVKYKTVPMNWVLDTLSNTKNGMNIIIFDACRNNPFPHGQRAGSRGLAVVSTVGGALIGYSTAPDTVAEDGKTRNSPYAQALLRYMPQPGVPIEQMFKQVRIAVRKETQGRQIPWEVSSLVRNFAFAAAMPGG